MKRLVLIGCLGASAILSGFTACGKAPGPCDPNNIIPEAQACPDRASLGFAQEFKSGTWIGTSVQESILVWNYGEANLVIDSAALSANTDSAFALETLPSTFPATIEGNKKFLMRVTFTPKQAKLYTGKITMQSNSSNGTTTEFEVSGCGVPNDGGTSPCYRDGGVAP